MRLTTIKLTNFRCFGPKGETVSLRRLTAFVGANACGKSTILQSLVRMFGQTAGERELVEDDFHVSTSEAESKERNLSIEITLGFPELENDESSDAVAECFKHMVVSEPGETPYCRMRLEGTWSDNGSPEGVVEQRLYWITNAEDEDEETKREVQAVDRARIRIHYVPAARDPSRQIRQISGSTLNRLLRAVKWAPPVKESIEKNSKEIKAAFAGEKGIQAIHDVLSSTWNSLHEGTIFGTVKVQPVSTRFEEMLRHIEAVFSPSPTGSDESIERLSEGQKSLFYLAIVAAAFRIEEDVLNEEEEESAFDRDSLAPPELSILAVEEPENHISPHYLGRIGDLLREVCKSQRAQVVVTSHSPSIIHRVEPEEVRHLRIDSKTFSSVVSRITLPKKEDDAYKFVREAVRAYPELYFARLVVLGEGDSEEVVLPRLAEAHGIPIDRSFASIVPLGGRHVNHFWRLLCKLGIPFVTILDLDLGRAGGGWGRIKYALEQLIALGLDEQKVLSFEDAKGKSFTLTKEELNAMHKRPEKGVEEKVPFLRRLEKANVFFSAPLDLDYMMFMSFSEKYKGLGGKGPSIPSEEDENYDEESERVTKAVLKDEGELSQTYEDELEAFYWYRYLFLTRSKPVTHLSALASIPSKELKTECPEPLKGVLSWMEKKLKPSAKTKAGDQKSKK